MPLHTRHVMRGLLKGALPLHHRQAIQLNLRLPSRVFAHHPLQIGSDLVIKMKQTDL